MGLYNDYRGTSREAWKYNYSGAQLLGPAKAKYQQLIRLEREARNLVAALLKDMNVSPTDQKLTDGKTAIARYGNEREQCAVFVHEFGRLLDREYHLSLGDVTYFDLAPMPDEVDDDGETA